MIRQQYKNTRRKFEKLSIHGYTDFGMELARTYPTSQLIKLINNTYRTYGDKDTRTAMVEFNILQEVTKARYELLKMRGKQTYDGNNFASGSTKQNLSQTMKPGQVLHDSRQLVTSTDQSLVVNGQRYIHENMYRELENRATIQENDIKDFQKNVRERDKYIDELRNSLSGFASKALTEGNPDFTDLSYKNRPTRIAEAFHNVYDDEWTTALKALTHSKKGAAPRQKRMPLFPS
ncbi:unnamed protein product [Mytilus edulis]|uniref:Uncharacterized protein n=1 Tax=Mytilus edulis TaxID=6550 RepID=A0A8S3THN5_MYTED|nr:unnamed protein product [Mytilus edulis]